MEIAILQMRKGGWERGGDLPVATRLESHRVRVGHFLWPNCLSLPRAQALTATGRGAEPDKGAAADAALSSRPSLTSRLDRTLGSPGSRPTPSMWGRAVSLLRSRAPHLPLGPPVVLASFGGTVSSSLTRNHRVAQLNKSDPREQLF